ncbi:MAG: DUF3306 domain-containing protein [Paracoccaceae bacterium]|nr:DUF3306 domain-containing protein [Paracoccaceae bacterium]
MSDFWSRRRDAVAEEARAEEAALQAEEAAAAEATIAEKSDEDILADLDLPEPEALESPEAVRDFLASAVPQRLKTRALRQLWKLNPVLANLDGLVDYGEDFTDGATVIENLQTAYQVGKGMLKHVEALAANADDAEGDVAEVDVADEDDAGAEEEPTVAVTEVADEAPEVVQSIIPDEEPDAEIPPARRRMSFQFEAQA